MRILFVCHRFPYPPRSGGKLRAFHMIKHLSRSHEVTVVSPVRSAEEAGEAQGLAAHCARYFTARVHEPLQALRMVAYLPTPEPSSMGYFHSARLARQARDLLVRERFDLVLVTCSSVAHYVSGAGQVPKLLDFGDMDSQKWLDYARFKPFPLSAGYWLEGTKLERAEKRLARQFDLCTTVTRAELETLEGYRTGAATDWFPNGVDTEYFRPAAEPYDPDNICFVGRMDYYPNAECMVRFCHEVLPRIQAERPAATLAIVGAEPAPAVRRLAGLRGVTVTGSVPDVRPYLWRAAVVVAPLAIARGTQNKVLEAMAAGVPVVASPIAARGVDADAPEHLLVAEGAEELARAVLTILNRPAERARLADAGREQVLARHSWDAAMLRLDAIIERCREAFVVRSKPAARPRA